MKKSTFKKITAAVIVSAMSCSVVASAVNAAPLTTDMGVLSTQSTSSGTVIYSTDFEDGDVSAFTNRGENDTTELSASTDNAVSGSTSLLASGRSKDWNGPAFRLDTVCEPNTEYLISAQIMGKYYTGAMLSYQYTTSDGETKYANLVQNINGTGWQEIKDVKVSFTSDVTDVYVYFEGGTDDLYIDDFSVVEVPDIEIEKDIPSLSDVYAGYFKIGTAITPFNLGSKPFMRLVEKHFSGSITLGNEMKPDAVINKNNTLAYLEETGDDENPQVTFSAAKSVLDYCNKNNIPVRIHTLVWHSQTPDWFFKENYADDGAFVSKEKMIKRMENYIKNYFTVLTELYPNIDFYACDVVNEAWLDDGNPRQAGEQGSSGSANSAWVKVFGDNSFIEYAFTFARQYAPEGCKLYYNDYNEYMTGKMNAIVEMAKELKAKGVIDGIGMQAHLDARQSLDSAFPSVTMFKNALKTYSELGLDIQVTELDATIPENSGEQYFDVQADYYSGIMDAIVEYKDYISAVVFWGVTDVGSWREKQQPLLFDGGYMAKPAFYSIIDDVEPLEPTTSNPSTSSTDDEIVWGDANCDENVDMADAVLIMQSIANPDKYGINGSEPTHITSQGKLNGDVYENGSDITSNDALSIQKYRLNLISELPE